MSPLLSKTYHMKYGADWRMSSQLLEFHNFANPKKLSFFGVWFKVLDAWVSFFAFGGEWHAWGGGGSAGDPPPPPKGQMAVETQASVCQTPLSSCVI